MKRLKRQDVIYKKQISKNTIFFHRLSPFIIFISIFLFLNLLSSYSFFFTNEVPVYKNSLLIDPEKNKKTVFFIKTLFLTKSITPASTQHPTTPTPKLKSLVRIPVANAETDLSNDYCLQVPVILYHHIEPLPLAEKSGHAQLTVDNNYFDSQMAYLAANKYNSISADELADALLNHQPLPQKSILITLDDGYEDNFIYAYEILKKYNIHGNFMISAGLIENNGYMNWNQIKEISNHPLMHTYNHTWSHAPLVNEEKEKIENEISTANKVLENHTKKNINIFTYPYGSFDLKVIEVLKKQKFSAAFSTIHGQIQCKSYIYALRRIHIGNAPLSSYGF